jgi:glycosyltransferase involved in cell wall biosynthesis
VHIHAVFSFSTIAAAFAARRHGVPYIVRPLGVLNRWGMEHRRRWIKRLSLLLLDRPVLRRAACIHYTSEQEARQAAPLNLRARLAVIPLGLDLADFDHLPLPEIFANQWPVTRERNVILYLSRIDPIKGLETLLDAFAKVVQQQPQALLVIAGAGDSSLQKSLRAQAKALGIEKDVLWTGHLERSEKLAALASATLFVLPSRSENFGIALLEAMASGLPCISTPGVALAVESASAVALTPIEPQALAATMSRLLEDPVERRRLSTAARQRAQEHYSLTAMSRSLMDLYQSVSPTVQSC